MQIPEPAPIIDHRPFAERVLEQRMGTCQVLTLATPVPLVVSFKGSFLTHPDFVTGEELLQELVVELLDKGTRKRDRFALAELIDDRGAQLNFYSSGLRSGFSGRALRDDVPDLLEAITEQLREPLFDPVEFEKAKARLAARFHRSLESTGSQASAALSRRLYSDAHPNFTPSPQYNLERLQAITLDDVVAYHAEHFGANDLHVVFVGDVDEASIQTVLADQLGAWEPSEVAPCFEANAEPQERGRSEVPMPDKSNVDVRMGHPVGVYRQHPDFIPLHVGNYILGGNFSARLMAIIRDEMGLTYGIRSSLVGFDTVYTGHWQVSVTLSQESVERGIGATVDVVRAFVKDGVTQDELDDKQTTLTGSFKVGLATTGGLAAALLRNQERGFGPAYLDRFPEEINAVDLDTVNAAIRTHLDPAAFHYALAGTLQEDTRRT